MFDRREQPPNSARFTFLDPAAQEFLIDCEKAAKDLVAALRQMAGRNPYDRALSDLVGELSTRSDPFRARWAAHNVRYRQTGTKRLHHPIVGDLELSDEIMQITADTDLRLAIFTAEPGTRSEEALNLLASWAGTPDQRSREHPAADDAARVYRAPHPDPRSGNGNASSHPRASRSREATSTWPPITTPCYARPAGLWLSRARE